jgi:hypothetical protein
MAREYSVYVGVLHHRSLSYDCVMWRHCHQRLVDGVHQGPNAPHRSLKPE